jgi:hypothetical protein
LKTNADGSTDLYFGPNAPADLESNWIPTMGKERYLWLRLYLNHREREQALGLSSNRRNKAYQGSKQS